MQEYMESYPLICVGWILAYPSYGGPRDHRRRAFDIHSGNQSSRLVDRVLRVHKGHTVTYVIGKQDIGIKFDIPWFKRKSMGNRRNGWVDLLLPHIENSTWKDSRGQNGHRKMHGDKRNKKGGRLPINEN